MTVLHRLLHGREGAVGAGEALDRGERRPLELRDEEQARAHRLAVEEDRAGATGAVLATDVGAGEVEVFP